MERDYSLERNWYILQTSPGFENVAKTNLERRIESMNMQDLIFQVLIPEETYETQNSKGEKVFKVRKSYPGYVFIEMIVTYDSWFIVRNTPSVTGFLGSSGKGAKPVPLSPDEINPILQNLGMIELQEFTLEAGSEIEVIAGPFKDTIAKIISIDEKAETVKILVNMFGRDTEADIPFNDIKER